MKIYVYPKCSTCKKAVQLLDELGIAFDAVDISLHPPTKAELAAMLELHQGRVGKLLNTSGLRYKALGMKEKILEMSPDEVLTVLAGEGMLVRRPFLLSRAIGLLGFNETAWRRAFDPSAMR